MNTEPRSPEPQKPPTVELGLELQDDIDFVEGQKLMKSAEAETQAVSEAADTIVEKVEERGSELTLEEEERLERVKVEKPKGAFRRFTDWIKGNSKTASGEIVTEAKPGIPAEIIGAVAAAAIIAGGEKNETAAPVETEKPMPASAEQAKVEGSVNEQRAKLAAIFEQLSKKELDEKDMKLYQSVLKKGATYANGSYSKVSAEEQARLKQIEQFSEDEYRQMLKGEIPWKMNAVWRAMNELRSGKIPGAKSAEAKSAPASAPAEGVGAAGVVGIGLAAAGVIAAAEAFGKDTGEVGAGDAPDYEEVTVTDAATMPDETAVTAPPREAKNAEPTVEAQPMDTQALLESHAASNKANLANDVEQVRKLMRAPDYKNYSLTEQYENTLEGLRALLEVEEKADAYVMSGQVENPTQSAELAAIVAAGRAKEFVQADIDYTEELLKFAIKEEERLAKAKSNKTPPPPTPKPPARPPETTRVETAAPTLVTEAPNEPQPPSPEEVTMEGFETEEEPTTKVDISPMMADNLIDEVNEMLGDGTLNETATAEVSKHLADIRKKLDEFKAIKTAKERKIAARGYREAMRNILKPKQSTQASKRKPMSA